ncbi:hypothetical protein [Trichocoleus sp. FACHB-262]|uniref:hypothetical protein n=1 Tax=Trichocoleus sp. FACHB-262 TaxID=2692869 RepID=UPI001684DBDC|nr:hypothetical protein [Trichocoleus sp. FACHB-262]MBD2120193.1 hypothetical protein [Trichocoleus sp. FACHB-262]
MPDLNNRKRLTVIASPEGIQKAERALIRLGFESKANFAKAQLISRNAVTNFFLRRRIQADTFKRICHGLRLDWNEISEGHTGASVEVEKAKLPKRLEIGDLNTIQEENPTQTALRRITVVDQQNETKAIIVLEGDIISVDNNFRTTMEALLKIYGGATIRIEDIQAGSIRITLIGAQQDIERLIVRIASREFTELNGLNVRNIQILNEERLGNISNSVSDNKWNSAQIVISNSAIGY